MCYFVPYIELAVTHTSVLTILAITVERYYAICLPLQVGSIFLMRLQYSAKKWGLGCVKMTSRKTELEHKVTQPRASFSLLSVLKFSSPQASIVWTKTKACLTCLVAWLFAFGLTAPIISITTFTPDPDTPACLTSVSRVDNYK